MILNKYSERVFFKELCRLKKLLKNGLESVSIGIANNKTLSKIANHLAKKDELGTQVVELLDRRQIEIALKVLEVGDIWGIGSRISKFLQSNSIQTAYDYILQIHDGYDNI